MAKDYNKTLGLMTINEAAAKCQDLGFNGITKHFIRKRVKDGTIPHVKNGNREMVTLDDIAEAIAKSKVYANNEIGGERP